MRLQDARTDVYRRFAKSEGYRSRAAFKLKEISEKYRLLHTGQLVLDFGCAPGGWLQVAAEEVGGSGFVLGVDLSKVVPSHPNTKTIVADVNEPEVTHLILEETHRMADVVLSDLSPKISGVWELDHLKQIDLTSQIVSYMPKILVPGGSAVLKVFEGEMLRPFIRTVQESYVRIHLSKPAASRRESSEIYLVCLNYLGRRKELTK